MDERSVQKISGTGVKCCLSLCENLCDYDNVYDVTKSLYVHSVQK